MNYCLKLDYSTRSVYSILFDKMSIKVNQLNKLCQICADYSKSSQIAKQAVGRYREFLLSANGAGINMVLRRFVADSALVVLNQAVLRLVNIPKSDNLKLYHECFAWLKDIVNKPVVQNLVDSLELDNELTEFDHSITILDEHVPATLRKALGEHWTPAGIVDFIIEHTIDEHLGDTFDPAVGGGAFMLGWLRCYYQANCPEGASFTGYDINPTSLVVAGLNLLAFQRRYPKTQKARVVLKYKDSLLAYSDESEPSELFTSAPKQPQYNYVIGNPPYVRIHNIKPAKLRNFYREKYPKTARGRFDLYMLFIELAFRALKNGGKLGYVVSNKILTSDAARGVRNLLASRFSLSDVLDLADSKLFQAAVLPVILTAEKRKVQTHVTRYTIARETSNPVKIRSLDVPIMRHLSKVHHKKGYVYQTIRSVKDEKGQPISIESFNAHIQLKSGNPWYFTSNRDASIIGKIETNTTPLVDHCTNISVGIKSTADDVFCNPITQDFIIEKQIECDFVKPYVRGPNIHRWQISWSGKVPKKDTYIIYPHLEVNGKTIPVDLKILPNITKWLRKSNNYKLLSNRTYILEAGRKWYEIWVPQKPSYFEVRFKIVTPDFSTHNAFALDTEKRWCGGSAFMAIPKIQEKNWCLFLLGLLNSNVLEYYHKKVSSTFIYAGRYRHTVSALKKYPVPKVGPATLNEIVTYVARLLGHPDDAKTERQLNIEVARAYKLNCDDLIAIQEVLHR